MYLDRDLSRAGCVAFGLGCCERNSYRMRTHANDRQKSVLIDRYASVIIKNVGRNSVYRCNSVDRPGKLANIGNWLAVYGDHGMKVKLDGSRRYAALVKERNDSVDHADAVDLDLLRRFFGYVKSCHAGQIIFKAFMLVVISPIYRVFACRKRRAVLFGE